MDFRTLSGRLAPTDWLAPASAVYRHATGDEFDMLIEMGEWKDEYMVLEASLPEERLVRKLKNVNAKGNSWYVWEETDEYLAWVIVHWHGKQSEPDYPDMMKLFVRKDFRRQGVASKLIRACEEKARARGFSKMGLSVHPEDDNPAIDLYKSLGYDFTDTPPYPFGQQGAIVVDMARAL